MLISSYILHLHTLKIPSEIVAIQPSEQHLSDAALSRTMASEGLLDEKVNIILKKICQKRKIH